MLTGLIPASMGVYSKLADWKQALPDVVTLPRDHREHFWFPRGGDKPISPGEYVATLTLIADASNLEMTGSAAAATGPVAAKTPLPARDSDAIESVRGAARLHLYAGRTPNFGMHGFSLPRALHTNRPARCRNNAPDKS